MFSSQRLLKQLFAPAHYVPLARHSYVLRVGLLHSSAGGPCLSSSCTNNCIMKLSGTEAFWDFIKGKMIALHFMFNIKISNWGFYSKQLQCTLLYNCAVRISSTFKDLFRNQALFKPWKQLQFKHCPAPLWTLNRTNVNYSENLEFILEVKVVMRWSEHNSPQRHSDGP